MASSVHTNFQIYNDLAQTSYNETLVQNTAAFNEASNGAIVLGTSPSEGYYQQRAYYEAISGLVSRRDLTADPTSLITQLGLVQDEQVWVKLFRKFGPVVNTRGMFRTILRDPAEFSVLIGEQAAKATAIDQLNEGIRACVAALSGVASNTLNVSAASPTDTISTDILVQTLAKLGDAANDIVLWVMHSVSYYALVRQQMATYPVENVSGFNIATGTPVTMGRPVLVTDSPALGGVASPQDPLRVLGLRRGAILMDNSEIGDVVVDDVTGGAQLGIRVQGEFAYDLGILGFRYDFASGGNNPLDAAIATSSNWDQAFTNAKSLAGVLLIADTA